MAWTNKALLTRLHIKQLPKTRTHRKATEKLLKDFQADPRAGRAQKVLFPNSELITQLSAIANEARRLHYDLTAPWLDTSTGNARILPASLYKKHTAKMDELKAQYEHLRTQLKSGWDDVRNRAIKDLGLLASADDYPDAKQLDRLITFDIHYEKVPEHNDFRVQLAEKDRKELQKQIQARADHAINVVQQTTYARLHEVIEKLAVTMNDPKKRFAKTLITHVGDLTDIISDLNLGNDPKLNALSQKAAKLANAQPEEIREDKKLRKDLATNARKLADEIHETMKVFQS
jgi:hypothetical protein